MHNKHTRFERRNAVDQLNEISRNQSLMANFLIL